MFSVSGFLTRDVGNLKCILVSECFIDKKLVLYLSFESPSVLTTAELSLSELSCGGSDTPAARCVSGKTGLNVTGKLPEHFSVRHEGNVSDEMSAGKRILCYCLYQQIQ